MKVLCAAVGALVLLMLVYSLLELTLPGGRLRPYVRLLMLLSLLVTAVSLAGDRAEAADWPWSEAEREQRQLDGEAYAAQGERLAADLAADAGETYSEQLAQQVRGLIAVLPGVAEAEVGVEMGADGAPCAATIRVQGEAGDSVDADAVRELAGGLLGLSPEAIDCREVEHE